MNGSSSAKNLGLTSSSYTYKAIRGLSMVIVSNLFWDIDLSRIRLSVAVRNVLVGLVAKVPYVCSSSMSK